MNSTIRARLAQNKPWWLVVATAIAAVWTFSACGSEERPDEASGEKTLLGTEAPFGGSTSGSAPSSPSSSGAQDGPEDGTPPSGSSGGSTSGGAPDASATPAPEPGPTPVPGATEPNLKVAFVADTNAGSSYAEVLDLIKREGTDLVVFQGDLTYAPTTAGQWLSVTDGALDDGTTKIPYFIARGNHDVDWKTISEGLATRLGKWGIASEHDGPTQSNYSMVYKGLKIVLVDDTETSNPTRNEYLKQRLEGDPHLFKVCSWHRNMRNTNAGSKSDEMPWAMYETCRQYGAIVAQGHSHTYSRSKTMTADQALTVDPACSDPFALCVGPGKHFFFDSSIGGVSLRALENTEKPHWASTYAADFGALFIEFNVDGDARKAKGYFKNVEDVIIDPPQSSGKSFFTITSSN